MKDIVELSGRLNIALGANVDADISRMCGVSRSTPGKWRKGVPPGSDKLAKICRWLGVSPNWILLGIGPEKLADCLVDQKNGKIIGRIDKPQDKVSEAMRTIEEWIRSVEKPDQRAWAIVDGLEREYKEFVEWQKKREQVGGCGTPSNNESAINYK